MEILIQYQAGNSQMWPAAWTGRKTAMVFTLASTVTVQRVTLPLSRLNDIGAGTVELWSTTGSPAQPNAQLASEAYDASAWSESAEDHSIDFDPGIELSAGTYAIVLTQASGNIYNCIKWRRTVGGGGSGGWYYVTEWLAFDAWDYIVLGTYTGGGGSDPPTKASVVTPTNGATGVSPIVGLLDWAKGDPLDPTETYNFYFGTTSGNLTLVVAGTSATIYAPPISPLAWSTTYYWRVDAINAYGTTTGDEWSFTTGAFDPPINGGPMCAKTTKRLVAVAQDRFYYEDL